MTQPVAYSVAIIGGGPAGLMAAEVLAEAGLKVQVFDAMPSMGRKFLLAGVGGMNITHAEPFEPFVKRYRARAENLQPLLARFGAQALREWIHGLGIETFVGSSSRVFPTDMKAAPLLRAWLKRLREQGVQLHTRSRWIGWDSEGDLRIETPEGEQKVSADATLLALGGASWARLGSDGAWQALLAKQGVALAPLEAANCGFEVASWSEHLRSKFAGAPIKTVAAWCSGLEPRRGEFVLTESGVEGSLIYALSAELRDAISAHGQVLLHLDLMPQLSLEKVTHALQKARGSRSMAKHLQSQLGLDGAKAGLLRECTSAECFLDPARLAAAIKDLSVVLVRPRPLDEAISSAGGVPFAAMDQQLMLKALPGVFCAGEMLDWEAPTGGYLLTACFSTGRAAAQGVLTWLAQGQSVGG